MFAHLNYFITENCKIVLSCFKLWCNNLIAPWQRNLLTFKWCNFNLKLRNCLLSSLNGWVNFFDITLCSGDCGLSLSLLWQSIIVFFFVGLNVFIKLADISSTLLNNRYQVSDRFWSGHWPLNYGLSSDIVSGHYIISALRDSCVRVYSQRRPSLSNGCLSCRRHLNSW